MTFDVFRGKRVYVTGHTGFKGAWLSAWLLELGAEVGGFAKDIPTTPALFEALGLEGRMRHTLGDVRDLARLRDDLEDFDPEVVLHLAAQALVRESYRDPVGTFATNVLGTVHVLEACRGLPRLRALVNITSDKCYENREWCFAYRENDAMGGADPYSASKGAAELVFASFARSFYRDTACKIASARAGNVIGGGDFAPDRLVPDCVRAWSRNQTVVLRNPGSVRPFQHVLEPLSGYLVLARALLEQRAGVDGEGFNFGPNPDAFVCVSEVARAFAEHFPEARATALTPEQARTEPHEAGLLKLSCEKAQALLGWRPTLDLATTLDWTATWYQAHKQGGDLRELTRRQLLGFMELHQRGAAPSTIG